MKKSLLCTICLMLLLAILAGCHETQPNLQTIPTQETTAETTIPTESVPATLPPEQPGVPLLDQGQADGNLVYIPNPNVESMTSPEIRLYGNGLLLYEHTEDGVLQLKRISLEDGCLLSEASYSVGPSVGVQIGNGFIGLCDRESGKVLLLNEELELDTTYDISLGGDSWYLNQKLETLYVFYADEGVLSWDLATGQSWWILENGAFIQPIGSTNGYVLFSYTDRDDQKTYIRCLDLSAAILETVPVDGFLSAGVRGGGQWLLQQDAASGQYIFVNQDTAGTFTWKDGAVQLISGRRKLLVSDGTYRNICLYDLEGKFESQCALPQKENAVVGDDFVWSGYWQGYFFRDTYDNAAHLLFWNTELAQDGENLAMEPYGQVESTKPVLEQALYQRAAELSDRFGVDIRIAEQCALKYSHYEADALVDPIFVREALDVLEKALNAYPEGFFQQLLYGNLRQIRIELAANLRGKEGMDSHPISIGGFAQTMTDHYLIVLDGLAISQETVYHEVSHLIDKRLEWDAMLRPDALFSEETWLSLQPEGFCYAGSYTDIPTELQRFENSGYFVNSYAMTFPTEDRATLMALMMVDRGALQENPGMVEKMRYYANCIRDCFGIEDWPEITVAE